MFKTKIKFLGIAFLGLIAIILLMTGSSVSASTTIPSFNASTQMQLGASLVVTPTVTITPTVASALQVTPTKTLTVPAPTATKTLPAPTATKAVTVAAPTATKTATLPAATATRILTASVPTATKTATLPAATATKTVTAAVATPTKIVAATPTKSPTVAPKAVSARAGTVSTLSTAFAVQNAQGAGSTAANVTATFYNNSGGVDGTVNRSIGPNLSSLIDQRLAGGGLDSFSNWQGSVVLSSNTQLAAVVNEYSGNAASLGADFRYDTYAGLSNNVSATRVLLPQLLKNVVDTAQGKTYNSTISIQNTNLSATANVTVTYTSNTGVNYVHMLAAPIQPGASVVINLETETATPALPYTFFGSGVVTSNQNIAVVVNQNAAGTLLVYTGFTAANQATTLYVSQLLRNVYDAGQQMNWGTGMMVMAANGGTANVTVTYTNRWTGASAIETYVANPTANIDQRFNPVVGSPFYGAATISANVPIVALVNMVTDSTSFGVRAMTYRAFAAANGASTIFLPQLLKEYYDSGTGVTWGTGVAGTLVSGAGGTVTITYFYNGAQRGTRTEVVSASSPTITFDQRSDSAIPNGTLLSAVITSPSPLVVTVNTVGGSTAPGDSAGNYPGIAP